MMDLLTRVYYHEDEVREMETSKRQENAQLITLSNNNGLEIIVSNFGARIVSIKVPVPTEGKREIAIGFDEISTYQKSPYLGATIGRTAGRIAQGVVQLDGEQVQLMKNEGTTTLHGGESSFESVIWRTLSIQGNQVVFEYISMDGTNGFPGNLVAQVSYTLTEDNEVIIEYRAYSDKETLYNPTNHVYFNLAGSAQNSVFDHMLQVKSNEILTLNQDNTMTGERLKTAGTIFDFKKPTKISQIFNVEEEQVKIAGGLDHPFLLNSKKEQAILESPDRKVTVKMTTDRQSVVIYTIGHWAEGLETSTGPLVYGGAITLEAQQPPGSEKNEELPSIVLPKDQSFYSKTSYQILSK